LKKQAGDKKAKAKLLQPWRQTQSTKDLVEAHLQKERENCAPKAYMNKLQDSKRMCSHWINKGKGDEAATTTAASVQRKITRLEDY
jgi:NAD(P)H-nitrite reductase large subunit